MPVIKLLSLSSLTTDLTTYTFTETGAGEIGACGVSIDIAVNGPFQRSPAKRIIFACIHAEDLATVFGVTSCTLGGVAGTELFDAGGLTTVNSAIYGWDPASLINITTTTVVVTMSEACTGCVVSVISAENVGFLSGVAAASSSGTGVLTLTPTMAAATDIETFPLCIIVSTCSAINETLRVAAIKGGVAPMILYDQANAEFRYGVAYSYLPQYHGSETAPFSMQVDWSGATTSDAIAIVMA